ncbi:NADP-dependent malic enzyme-like [Mya arenaria]|uniref:NADP-dependent malic enzyme-like n=1 Tax=Mya arenaria TaxID=6604 RepID=UPI0022E6EBFD|nr:NADP-dependent malic enzyme-like [Mya arenaria]
MSFNSILHVSNGLRSCLARAKISQVSVAAFHTSQKNDTRPKSPLPFPKKEMINNTKIRGIDILRDPKLNKGQAFTLRERQLMGIHGLLPPVIIDQETQLERVRANFRKRKTDVDRYIYLMALYDRNERLFYRSLIENVEEMMPIVYTPTVGKVCQEYGLLYRRPRGLFLSINDKDHLYEMVCNWPENDVKAVVVTDGERILGLGDLGVNGMGIPVGKLSLYTALGGIPPHQCLPVILDVGTNNKKLLEDPLYIGKRAPRITGPVYDEFIEEFVEAIVRRYGQTTLIQFEDFGNSNAFRILEKYCKRVCCFNDDIQGTASVAVAGIIASLRITKKKLSDNVFVMQGAGEANIGIANLLSLAMTEEGTPLEDARSKIWMVDSRGLIVNDRPKGGVSGHKKDFAKNHRPIDTLEEVVKEIKPTALIGAAAVSGAFTETILRDMAAFNERPIIFALSNPTSMAECTAEEAYTLTEGRCVFASGSPFLPVTYNGQTFYPGQGNNAYIFPGVALGLICFRVPHVTDSIFLRAAQACASLVTDEHLAQGRLYPPLSEIQNVSRKIATELGEQVYKEHLALLYPEPKDKEQFVVDHMYSTAYECFEPDTWDWPSN